MSEPRAAGEIHPTAIVDPGARVADSARIGPWTILGPGVEIGERVRIGANVLVERDTSVDEDCVISHGAVLGTDPQDLKYGGEPTRLVVGARTVIREYCTLNRATSATGVTRVGADCLLMAYVHVAHDCVVGDRVILGNGVQLAGHCTVQDWVIIGGLSGVHQFCRIGAHAFIGGASKATQDVPPFLIADGNPCEPHGINVVGLRRRGFDKEAIDALRGAYRDIFKSRERNIGQALDGIEGQGGLTPEVEYLVRFIRESERGIVT